MRCVAQKTALSFDDVLLIPARYSGNSRKDVDLSTQIAGIKLSLPIISANMPGVTGFEMATVMHEMGGLGIIDRITEHSPKEFEEWKKSHPSYKIGASIGIGEDAISKAKELVSVGVDLICIDVAHANQRRTYEVYDKFRSTIGKFPLIIGNWATPGWDREFDKDEFLAMKIGIGGGSVCTTRVQTGCGMPTLQSVLDCSETSLSIIADGGIKNSGDIVKSLAAGAHAVMIGGLLAGTDEAPGQIVSVNGKLFKVYRGNASAGAKAGAGLSSEFIEGAETLVPLKGSARKVLKSLEDGIRSGFSYCGSMNLRDLHEHAEFIRITPAGYRESLPHGTL